MTLARDPQIDVLIEIELGMQRTIHTKDMEDAGARNALKPETKKNAR